METQRFMMTIEMRQYKKLQRMSQVTKVPIAAMIRRGVDLFIESKEGKVIAL